MAISGFVSSKVILARLYRELGLTTEISESEAIEFIADALALIGSHYQYNEMSTILELDADGKAILPTNFYKLTEIRYQGNPVGWSTSHMNNDYVCDDCEILTCCTEYNFYINDSYVITNIKELAPNNELCISYLGVPLDSEGFPMVPDDIYYFKACVAYVTSIIDYREWRKGNCPDKVYKKSEQDWLYYVNSARGSGNMPTLSQLENLKNIMTKTIPSLNGYFNNFRDTSKQERRKRY